MASNERRQPSEEALALKEDEIPLHRDKYLEFKNKLQGFERQKMGLDAIEQDLKKSISRMLYGNDDERNVERVNGAYGNLTLAELKERHEEARFLSVWDLRVEKPSQTFPRILETLVVLTLTVTAGMILLTEFVWKTDGISLLLIIYAVSVSIGALAILETTRGVINHVRKA